MRILQINSVYGYGSTGRIVENLHKAIQKSGHESYVIYGRGNKNNDKNVFRIGNKFEQAVELMGTRLFNKHGQYSYITTEIIIKKIKEINPDIVHLHNIHGYYVNFIELVTFLKQSRIKIVWLLHDTWLISGSSAGNGGLTYKWENTPDLSILRKIGKEYPKHLKISSRQGHKNYELKKRLLSESNITFVTPSNWLSNIIRKSYLNNNEIVTIHNGVDTTTFEVLKVDKKDKKINVLGVASVWEESKGLKYFDKLANDLNDNFIITVVGVTEKQEKLLNKKIHCFQRTDSVDDLVRLYNNADIFVNPTLYDNFPTVNIESQACGTPVITFDTGGSGESILEGETGQIIEKGNYEELLQTVQNLERKNNNIIEQARSNAENYSINNMQKEYLELYHNILFN